MGGEFLSSDERGTGAPIQNPPAIWAALVDTKPKRRFVFANAPGWYGPGFALPGKFFCSDQAADPVKIDPNSIEHVGAFATGDGNLRDWRQYVAKPARKSSPLCVSISAALAAPLLRRLNMDSFAINWFGSTSEGKTLALKVAASVAGLFGPGGDLPSWADSIPGFEGQAMGHRDCVLPLDETADGEKEMPLDKALQASHASELASPSPRSLRPARSERRLTRALQPTLRLPHRETQGGADANGENGPRAVTNQDLSSCLIFKCASGSQPDYKLDSCNLLDTAQQLRRQESRFAYSSSEARQFHYEGCEFSRSFWLFCLAVPSCILEPHYYPRA